MQDKITGYIVPIRRPDEIARALRRYINDPSLLIEHKRATFKLRRLCSIERYGNDIVTLINSLI